MSCEDLYYEYVDENTQEDPSQSSIREKLEVFFEKNSKEVFFSRQLEVQNEDTYFHWVTNRAVHDLVESGNVRSETRKLKTGGEIHLLWHQNYRYYRRKASEVVKLVEEYADPNICIGMHGEAMVLEAFARFQFIMRGRHINSYQGKKWAETNNNLDFIFERDGVSYGIEVKNMLGYMDQKEFNIKMQICKYLNIRPVFVVRMMPRTWINELVENGGYAMIMKYQLYPWTHKELARKIAKKLNLPVDAPNAIADGTMQRFLKWQTKNM